MLIADEPERRHDVGAIADEELLARHAPILAFHEHELFFPCPVENFVAHSTMFDDAGRPLGPASIDRLDGRWSPGAHLRFIDDDERARASRQPAVLRRGGSISRLARVGLFGRLLDALFLFSLCLRPTVPRRTTAAALRKAQRLGLHDRPACYGRVIRAGEWMVAHYSFFYAMNDWRSTHRGLNDHEADWEQVWVFIDPQDKEPIWVAATNHSHHGPDLRRHWRDPELTTVGHRPVLHVAAGSHALMFQPGEYVTRIEVPHVRWLIRAHLLLRRLLRRSDATNRSGIGPALGVPFIDRATSKGRRIESWDLVTLDQCPWAETFRGLWGLDTLDPLEGERGPGGPKFDRRGNIRASWADPTGFAGLHGTPPPSAMATRVSLTKLDQVLDELDADVRCRGRLLPLTHQTRGPSATAGDSAELTRLLQKKTELEGLRERLERGEVSAVGIRDHLLHPAVPLPEHERDHRLLAAWAAITTPALLAVLACAAAFDRIDLIGVALLPMALTIPADHLVRNRPRHALVWAVMIMCSAAATVVELSLVIGLLTVVVAAMLFTGAATLMITNLQELASRRDTRSRDSKPDMIASP